MMSWGPDENRAIEAVAALMGIFPRDPAESDQQLTARMAEWALQQGPNVRRDAVQYAIGSMVVCLGQGYQFEQLAEIGLQALYDYNWTVWGDAPDQPSGSEQATSASEQNLDDEGQAEGY